MATEVVVAYYWQLVFVVATVERLYMHTLGTKDRMLISQVLLIPRGI